MIKHEIELSWSKSLAIAWSLIWRIFVLNFVPSLLLQHFVKTADPYVGLLLSIAQLILTLIFATVAVWWLFGKDRRVGSLRVMLMEQAHYQALASNPTLQVDAAPQSGLRP